MNYEHPKEGLKRPALSIAMADASAPVTDASADAASAELDRLHAFQKQKAGESGIATFLEALGLHMCHGLLEALLRKVHDLPALKDLSEDALALAVAPLNLKPKGIKFKKLWSALEQLRAENSTIFVPTMVAEPEMQKNGMMERPLVQPLDYHTSVTHESASMDAMPAPPRPGLGYNMKYLGPAAAFPSLFNPGTSTATKDKVAKIKEGIKLKKEGKAFPPPLLPTDQPIEGVWRSELAKELLDLANMFGHANEGSKRPEVAAAKARAAAADCAKSAAADAAEEAPKAFRGVGAPLTNALRNMGQYMHMFESDEVADVKFTKHESEAKAQSSRKSRTKRGKKGKAKSQRTERDKENAAPQHKESAVSKMIEKNKARLLNFMHKENKACAGERRTKNIDDVPCAGEHHFVDHDSIKCAGERHVKNADEKVCAGVRHVKDDDERICAGVRHVKDDDERLCAGVRHVKDADEKVCAGVRHVKDADEKKCAGVRHIIDDDEHLCAGVRRVANADEKVCAGVRHVKDADEKNAGALLAKRGTSLRGRRLESRRRRRIKTSYLVLEQIESKTTTRRSARACVTSKMPTRRCVQACVTSRTTTRRSAPVCVTSRLPTRKCARACAMSSMMMSTCALACVT